MGSRYYFFLFAGGIEVDLSCCPVPSIMSLAFIGRQLDSKHRLCESILDFPGLNRLSIDTLPGRQAL